MGVPLRARTHIRALWIHRNIGEGEKERGRGGMNAQEGGISARNIRGEILDRNLLIRRMISIRARNRSGDVHPAISLVSCTVHPPPSCTP